MEKSKVADWVFIVNPSAGSGFAAGFIPELRKRVKEQGIDAEIKTTQGIGHATQLARESAASGSRYIIAVGGDGTMNEVSRGIAGDPNVITGIIPAGTGNDFVQILGFPDRFSDHHWKIFFEQNTILMDAGFCNGNIFLNGMGLGFDAQVAAENYEPSGAEKKGGKSKYIGHILKILFRYREKLVKIQANGSTSEQHCFIHTVGNGRRFAGGFHLTPQAIANDGLLDICMIEQLSLFKRLKILMMVPKGKHIYNSSIKYYRTAGIQLEFSETVPYHLDGELFKASHFDVTVKKEFLKIIYNPIGNHFFQKSK